MSKGNSRNSNSQSSKKGAKNTPVNTPHNAPNGETGAVQSTEIGADELKDMVLDEALLLAHHKKFHINDLTKLALKYEEITKTV